MPSCFSPVHTSTPTHIHTRRKNLMLNEVKSFLRTLDETPYEILEGFRPQLFDAVGPFSPLMPADVAYRANRSRRCPIPAPHPPVES